MLELGMVLGGLVAILNFHTSFLRHRLHKRMEPDQPYQPVSGFPLIGSPILALVWWNAPAFGWVWWASLILFAVDTGGPHWFAWAVFRPN